MVVAIKIYLVAEDDSAYLSCMKGNIAGPAPPVRLVRFQPDHFSGQKYV